MKIALASAPCIDRDIEHNFSQMERFAREAAASGAQLICFGEAFLQGFDCCAWQYDTDCKMAVEKDSAWMQRVQKLSQTCGIDILFGFIEREAETLYSSCALIVEGKLHHLYRRISRGWKEYWHTDEHYREGETVEAFPYRGKKAVIALCGDLWDMTERFCLGEDVLIWPVYISYTPAEWESGVKQEYAEKALYACPCTLLCNSITAGDAYGGAFLFADGKTAAELPMGQGGLLIVDV